MAESAPGFTYGLIGLMTGGIFMLAMTKMHRVDSYVNSLGLP